MINTSEVKLQGFFLTWFVKLKEKQNTCEYSKTCIYQNCNYFFLVITLNA